ncbi:DUF4352 domain-containing protein [Rummeliibacillus stabekisii]|uniref:DUF4352 domain-containing protein n=1 Tax=Rummeliibacillus stabekisii TaxID=241244 RepID=A0A143HFD1_9BACL|nr:DUF4352 domain-containing protein [Rummeliibacillus stabekisii]AMX00449.1 hypothetical protein ATY39_14120 [Rummeliibacillus stabekisii]
MNKWVKGCLGCFGVFVVLIILLGGCMMFFTEKEEPHKVSDSNHTNNSKTTTFKIGDSVKFNDAIYKVISTKNVDSVPQNKANGTYYIVELKLKNISNEKLTVAYNDFEIINGEKKYSLDESATWAYNNEKNKNSNSFFMQDVNPDIASKSYIVFDLPSNIIDKNIKLRIMPTMWADKNIEIELKR